MIAGLRKRLVEPQQLMHLSIVSFFTMFELTLDNVKEVLNVSCLAQPVHSVWFLSLLQSPSNVRAVMNFLVCAVIENLIESCRLKACTIVSIW
jgi:hypothetical protein